jgi:acyl-CoA thioesterase FadM
VTWIAEMHGARAARLYEIERQSGASVTDWPRPDLMLTDTSSVERFGDLILRARTDWAYVDVGSGRPRRMPPDVTGVFRLASDRAGDSR